MHTHPTADVFPLLTGREFDALTADIRTHGLREPITLHPDGSILDGRNRHRGCFKAGVEPRFETWNGTGSPIAFVLSRNLHRRHLKESQRALVAARLTNLGEGRPSKTASDEAVSQTAAASLLNVSRPSVQRAVKILARPDLVEAVEAGELTVAKAADIATATLRTTEQEPFLPEVTEGFDVHETALRPVLRAGSFQIRQEDCPEFDRLLSTAAKALGTPAIGSIFLALLRDRFASLDGEPPDSHQHVIAETTA